MRILFLSLDYKLHIIKEFADALARNHQSMQYRIFDSAHFYGKSPSKNINKWFVYDKDFKTVVKEFKPDYIFTRTPSHLLVPILEVKIPVIVWLVGDLWAEYELKKHTASFKRKIRIHFMYKDVKKIMERSFVILSISNYLKGIVDKRYPKKSTTLYLGVDQKTWYHVKSARLKHPCVGLLQTANIYNKTVEMLTLKKVLESMPDVTFYWAGDGPHQNMVLDVLGKYDNFEHLGRLEHPDGVREFLSEIDVYTLITGMDTFGVSLQEAQLMQRPVIATDIGGTPEAMQDGKTGFLVERGNADQIIEKIRYLLDNPEKAKEMGQAGRRFVEENFNWDKTARDLIRVLESRA